MYRVEDAASKNKNMCDSTLTVLHYDNTDTTTTAPPWSKQYS